MGTLAKRPHRGVKVESIDDFSGGLNTRFAANRIGTNESPSCLNVWTYTGALKKRFGYTSTAITFQSVAATFGTTPINIKIGSLDALLFVASWGGGNGTFYTTDGSTFNLVSYTTGTVTTSAGSAVVNGTGTAWTSLNIGSGSAAIWINSTDGAIAVSSVQSDTQLTLVQNYPTTQTAVGYWLSPGQSSLFTTASSLNGNAYMSSPNYAGLLSTSGTTWKWIVGAPKFNYNAVFKNYLFGGGLRLSQKYSRVSWSALKDATTWPAANFIDVTPDDGDIITGLFSDGQALIVLKQRSAHRISGDVFDPNNLSYSMSPISVPSDCFFLDVRTVRMQDGGYLIFGGTGICLYIPGGPIIRMPVSDIVQGEWDAISTPGTLQEGGAGDAVWWRGNYWFGTNTINTIGGVPNLLYVLDRNKAFWKWSPTSGFGRMALFQGSLYGISGGNLIKLDTSSSDGASAINGTWTSKVFDYNSQQSFGRLWVDFKKQSAGNLTVEYSIDEGAFTSSTVDMTTGTGTRVKSPEILIGQVGQSIQFRVSNNVAAQDFEVYSISWERKGLRN